jgi:hypothetical protein
VAQFDVPQPFVDQRVALASHEVSYGRSCSKCPAEGRHPTGG